MNRERQSEAAEFDPVLKAREDARSYLMASLFKDASAGDARRAWDEGGLEAKFSEVFDFDESLQDRIIEGGEHEREAFVELLAMISDEGEKGARRAA